MLIASPDYFRTLGIPLLAGRAFTDHDTETSLEVAVVSRSLAKRYWRNEDPVGRKISFDKGEHWITIAGVVGDVKEFGLAQEPPDQVYRPLTQSAPRGAGSRSANGHQPSRNTRAGAHGLRGLAPSDGSPVRLVCGAGADHCGNGYRLCAGAVSQTENREIGIRASLGGDPMDLIHMVIRHGMGIVVAGVALGLAGAVGPHALIASAAVRNHADRSNHFRRRVSAVGRLGPPGMLHSGASSRPHRSAGRSTSE
jgi:putative ABC transport system permease protein